MGLTMTSPGVMVKVKWSITCARARYMWNTFVTGMFLSGVPLLIDCDIITKTLATVAACFSSCSLLTPYILRSVLKYVFQFRRRLPTLTVALRPRKCVWIPWTWHQRTQNISLNSGSLAPAPRLAPKDVISVRNFVPHLSWNWGGWLWAEEVRHGISCLGSEPPVKRCWGGFQMFYYYK